MRKLLATIQFFIYLLAVPVTFENLICSISHNSINIEIDSKFLKVVYLKLFYFFFKYAKINRTIFPFFNLFGPISLVHQFWYHFLHIPTLYY